ncbi:hypothetical protein DLR60_16140 [Vibrio tarriae]|nr:hypothetical protein DLR60_16140 [Vibrio tarriae]
MFNTAAWFTNSFIIAEIMFSLSRTLNRGQLNLECRSSRHSFWRWTCVCLMLLRKMPFK